VLDQLFSVLHVFDKLSWIFLCVFADLRELHTQRRQCLSRAIVQFPGNVPPLGILRLQEPPRKVPQVRVASLKVLSTELHLGVECIRQCSIAFFAFTQLSLNPFALGNVPSNFRRADNLSAGVPDGRNRE